MPLGLPAALAVFVVHLPTIVPLIARPGEFFVVWFDRCDRTIALIDRERCRRLALLATPLEDVVPTLAAYLEAGVIAGLDAADETLLRRVAARPRPPRRGAARSRRPRPSR